jgi:predicted O-linked N-acetylglucosamine transferase (SPINDLY family)
MVHEAASIYERILDEDPRHAGALHLLGVTYHSRGDSEKAVQYIAQAIALDGGNAAYRNNLGVALRALGRSSEAAQAYRQALVIEPQYADAISNLATVLCELGRDEEALRQFQDALRLQPAHVDALFNLGNLRRDLGQTDEAIACYQKALAVRPDRADVLNNLGNALLSARRHAEAATAYRRAIAIDPGFAEAHLNLGVACAEQGQTVEAAACYEEAARLRPARKTWKLRTLGLCPVVFSSGEELDRYRSELEAKLDGCLGEPIEADWRALAADGFVPPFQLTHHGRHNRPLMEKFAAMFAGCFPKERPRLGGGKPRIGFLVTQSREAGFVRDMAGIVESLDRARFEVVMLCSQTGLPVCRQAIPNPRTEWVAFPDQLGPAVERITAARCDLVYHWQIGTDPLNYFLAFAPVAPLLVTGWGSHSTTGIPTIDYYLSTRLVEPDDADAHFTERLVRFGTLTSYQYRQPAPLPASRSDFGLPAAGPMYICPQRLEKFHPDCDPLFAGVLRGSPQGFLVLLEGNRPQPASVLRQRFERTLAGLCDRVIFLPSQNPADYVRLLSLADVVLDTPHYSGGFTAYDAFCQALPMVSLSDGFGLGSYVRGFYRKMDLEHLAAGTPEEYVAQAVRLGADRDYRQWIRKLIAERSGVLFEDLEAVREHEAFFESAIARVRKQGTVGKVTPRERDRQPNTQKA